MRVLLLVLVPCFTAWGAAAMWFQLAQPVRGVLMALWVMLGSGAMWGLWRAGRASSARHSRHRLLTGSWMVAAVGLLVWWQALNPSHQREWADDVARLLQADIQGDRVTLHNVRNFDWRTETDYTVRWETRQYDLSTIASVDLILSYWMGPHIAHTLVSFGFDDGRHLAFSLEIRKERHESFSAAAGFFRDFEQVIIAADERDIVRTRSNARGEDVYLYRVPLGREQARAVFLAYLQEAEALRSQPAFYNTLDSNCTTIVFDLARQLAPGLPIDWRLLASGHFAEYAFDQQALVAGHDYAQLQRLGHINARAQQADRDAGAGRGQPGDNSFSRAIRQGVPGWETGR
ncbi:MAG: DUF4105 domain-containing protein [Lautropia sp.]|nr:DUF4105 domain-containing protein [Lautropia sp.]